MSPRPSGWVSNGPAFLMALTRWGFSCKRADLHCPRKWAGPSEPEEEARAWGAVASLEARVKQVKQSPYLWLGACKPEQSCLCC